MPITRRTFLAGATALALPSPVQAQARSIDRKAVVARHGPRVTRVDPFSALTVGNGQFAFTADVTGLQTLSDEYQRDFPLCTASHWGWHSFPLPEGSHPADFRFKNYASHGRQVGYATESRGQQPLFNYLRENPHRLHLGRIGFVFSNGPIRGGDLTEIDQRLDLFSGVLQSRFKLHGGPVSVTTACDPADDVLAVLVESPLLADGRLSVRLAFAYGSPRLDMADWLSPAKHKTAATILPDRAAFTRTVDATSYFCAIHLRGGEFRPRGEHEFDLSGGAGKLAFTCGFSPAEFKGELKPVEEVLARSTDHWGEFWSGGGCIDLSASADAGAGELERRIVLSQYNTALHCSGPMPSAETGLLNNSWYGKFHLEMHWWHSVHFSAWDRFPLLQNSLPFYRRIIDVARQTAARQGYRGCRWPKMVGPAGHDSPSPVGPLLIWQQPHPIYYAELCYRHEPSRQTLEEWRDIVFESADFIASYAALGGDRYVLGPPLKTVSENTDATTTTNPTFELAYWRFGLRVAREWRRRLGIAPAPAWELIAAKLATPAVQDGAYLMQEGMTDTYTRWAWEHPALLGARGIQPGDGIDPGIMRNTVKKVFSVWDWDRAWGWDFPMAAMAAARAGEPELAVKALLIDSPKNHYHPNGHNYQRPGLTAYLPGNGGLLSATAMMSAGWTDGPGGDAPGFPKNGKWQVKCEGLKQWM